MRLAKNLTEGAIGKHIFSLAMPILGTSFVQMLYSFTDMAWLGRLDSQSVAAVGAVSVFTWIATSLSQVTKVGSEITVANALGKGDTSNAAEHASHSSTMALILGILIGTTYLLFASPLLSIYSLTPDIHSTAVSYMRIVALGMPLLTLAASYTGTYNATGHSQIPFTISCVGLILNMILDPICIFLLGWGVEGAACATILSQLIVCLLFIRQLRVVDHLLEDFPLLAPLRLPVVGAILYIGVPVALLNCLFAFIDMFMGRMASRTGGYIGVLTLTTGGQLEGITWNTAQGFSTTLSAFIAQNFGAGKMDRVYGAFTYTLKLTLLFGVFTSLFYFFGGELLFGIIVPDPAAYSAGGTYLRINAFSQLFMMLELCVQGYFYGIRKSIIPASISIGGNLLRIPLAIYLLHLYPTIETLWWVICASSILKGLVSALFYLGHRSKVRLSPRS